MVGRRFFVVGRASLAQCAMSTNSVGPTFMVGRPMINIGTTLIYAVLANSVGPTFMVGRPMINIGTTLFDVGPMINIGTTLFDVGPMINIGST
jgi:hypothetical protein